MILDHVLETNSQDQERPEKRTAQHSMWHGVQSVTTEALGEPEDGVLPSAWGVGGGFAGVQGSS